MAGGISETRALSRLYLSRKLYRLGALNTLTGNRPRFLYLDQIFDESSLISILVGLVVDLERFYAFYNTLS